LQPVDGTLRHKSLMAFYLLLCTGLMFIPIRGGFTVSTMNLGRVYYSDVQQLNHAAINPCFSLLDSYIGERKLNHMYRYMDDKEATRLFSQMTDTTDVRGVGEEQLFTVPRPNVILVVLESFSCKIMQSMGGVPGVAVNMDSLGREGILFTNFYATSWRTDRGLASILAAYPAQPNTSIMKFTSKCDGLPMFPKEMKQVGYNLKYYYGGDVNFTSMRSFLVNAGFTDIISEKDYPLSERLGKWGAHDEYVFNRLKTDLRQPSLRQPFLKVLQTSSSHDPFDVPYHKLGNKRLNAFAYADSCLGDFVRHFRTSPLWKNTVVIFVPDHLGNYPILKRNDNYAAFRYHIPLIMVGGAVRRPMKIDTYGSQVDIAATLLSQLGLSHRKFTFSKDILSPCSPHFAFSTFPNAFVLMDRDDSVSFDCDSRKVVMESGRVRSNHLQRGKAYLQKLFDDLSRR
jgi:phosphoglycerol transferase MdoB-like AlkP superfamily enzyme